ncbi:Holliday junction resolvase RuvX [Candidatus Peregrinibacteria bacterium HGW-Peregrinibacteria-1]|jgi:putative Holliday junction resolvase|nr:MAG: Holliday junction resolvase RuvX [Candidatus Peregrinibacteria bacterium HGW-Peregrinibacteria-1]
MILALDYGSKRIGLATGEEELKIAFPRSVLTNTSTKEAAQSIAAFCLDHQITKIVIGLPLNNPNYPDNPIMNDLKKFQQELLQTLPQLEIIEVDERYTSYQADTLIQDISIKSKKQKTNHLGRDAYAAQAILQHYFDQT